MGLRKKFQEAIVYATPELIPFLDQCLKTNHSLSELEESNRYSRSAYFFRNSKGEEA